MSTAVNLGPSAVVAGSGPSLQAIDYSRVDLTVPIVRVNNFFFERCWFLGRRIDLVQVGGDPRSLPFYFRTLQRAHDNGDYDLHAWSCQRPEAETIARCRLRIPHLPFRLRDGAVAEKLAAAVARYKRQPTSGVCAILSAHGHGATEIRLVGIDFYRLSGRYGFPVGRHVRDLLGRDIAGRGYDLRLHSPDMDLELLDYLQSRDDLRIYRTSVDSPMAKLLDLAPKVTEETAFVPERKDRPIEDWEGRDGLYPIGLLKVLRRVRRVHQRLRGEARDW